MFLIIDGSALLTTNFYGNLPLSIKMSKREDKYEVFESQILQTSMGIYTNAVFKTLDDILEYISFYKPTHIAVTFDKNRHTTFRVKKYPDYKGTRKPKPVALSEQFVTMKTILKDIGIPVFESDEFEADDIAGSIAKRFENSVDKVVLLTKDHDWLQLKSDKTEIWMMQSSEDKCNELYSKYNRKKTESWMRDVNPSYYNDKTIFPAKVFLYDDEVIMGEEGISYYQIPDLKGLAGDSADNIPGVKNVGPASAAPLLREYGTIENLYEAIENCENDKKKEKELSDFWKVNLGIKKSPLNALKKGKGSAFLSKDLATIITDIDTIPMGLDSYRYHIEKEKLFEVFNLYEMESLKSKYKYF